MEEQGGEHSEISSWHVSVFHQGEIVICLLACSFEDHFSYILVALSFEHIIIYYSTPMVDILFKPLSNSKVFSSGFRVRGTEGLGGF